MASGLIDIGQDMDILTVITEAYGLDKQDVRSIPALTLAYLGDCVYEMVIRTVLVEQGCMHVSDLNKAAVAYVRAGAQAELMHRIEPHLNEEELSAYKRGRNAKSASVARSASVAEYRTATGFEALLGYLYLKGETDRILELVRM